MDTLKTVREYSSMRKVPALALVVVGLFLSLTAIAQADDNHGLKFKPLNVCSTCSTLPFGINDRGQVTGVYFDAAGKGRGFLKTGNHYDLIDIPGAQFVEAQRANNGGYVLGDYVAADGLGRPWVRRPDGKLDLKPGFPGATFTGAIYITDSGLILGYATKDPAQAVGYFGYFLDGTTYSQPFSYPGANVLSTYPVALNRKGEMVGSVQFGTIENEHGWYRSRAGVYRLVDYPGAIQSEVFDITEDGLMLGRYQDAKGINHGYFLQEGEFTSFDYVGPQTYIWKINARGVVVGYSFQKDAYAPPAFGFEVQTQFSDR
jgi:hypothetical protein